MLVIYQARWLLQTQCISPPRYIKELKSLLFRWRLFHHWSRPIIPVDKCEGSGKAARFRFYFVPGCFFPKYILFTVIVPGSFSQNIFTIFGFDILHLRTTISTATPIWTAWYILLGILCEKKKKKHCVMRKSASRGFEISEQMKFKHSVIGKKKWSSFCLNMRYSLKNDVWPNKS